MKFAIDCDELFKDCGGDQRKYADLKGVLYRIGMVWILSLDSFIWPADWHRVKAPSQ